MENFFAPPLGPIGGSFFLEASAHSRQSVGPYEKHLLPLDDGRKILAGKGFYPFEAHSRFVEFCLEKSTSPLRFSLLGTDKECMGQAKSFRQIFIEQMGQNSVSHEEKTPFFDPTLLEFALRPQPQHRFSSGANRKIYAKQVKSRPQPEVPPEAFHPIKECTPPPTPPRTLDVKDLTEPTQLASVKLIESHLGQKNLLPITAKAFKRLYRATMRKNHPDHGGCARKFIVLREAFKSLESAFPK
jgi:hypothetical protein